MLVKLKARFGPTDKTRRAEMLIKYRKIQKAPRIKSLEPWLHEWEMIYHDAVELNLPDVAEDRVTVDFLRSIQDVNPGFLAYWIHNTEATDIYPTLYEIIQKFRIHIRQNPEQKLASHRHLLRRLRGMDKPQKMARMMSEIKPRSIKSVYVVKTIDSRTAPTLSS